MVKMVNFVMFILPPPPKKTIQDKNSEHQLVCLSCCLAVNNCGDPPCLHSLKTINHSFLNPSGYKPKKTNSALFSHFVLNLRSTKLSWQKSVTFVSFRAMVLNHLGVIEASEKSLTTILHRRVIKLLHLVHSLGPERFTLWEEQKKVWLNYKQK